jgi:DNA polymerase-3 subunit delta
MAAAKILTPTELKSTLAKNDPAPVYLLAGPDTWRAERTALWLKEKVLDPQSAEFNAQVLQADECTAEAIVEAASAYPMFGSKRFVWVRHAEALASGAALEGLLKYLESPVTSTLLVFTSAKLDKRLKFTTACARAGCAVDFQNLRGSAVFSQVARQAQSLALQLSRDAVEELVDLVGEDLGELQSELEKLALLQEGDGELGPEEVRLLVARSRDLDAFAVADLLSSEDPLPALRAWTKVRVGGGDPIGTAAILSWRLRQLASFRAVLDTGEDPGSAARRLGIPPWQARRLAALAQSSSFSQLRTTLKHMRQADRRAKSSRLGASLSYDLALLSWAVEALGPAKSRKT